MELIMWSVHDLDELEIFKFCSLTLNILFLDERHIIVPHNSSVTFCSLWSY